jgi:site-specific DNA-methyltransferase (adenine-specific)
MPEGLIDLRLGDWREVLAGFDNCDAVVTDGPYSKETHEGHNRISTSERAKRERARLEYDCLDPQDVVEFVDSWSKRCSGWMVAFTDDVLAPAWRRAYKCAGRYAFAPVVFYSRGSRCRMSGDGPSCWATWIMVSRPKERRFMSWGTLPGGYSGNGNSEHTGGKPLWLMRALVRDYTKPGDLIIDPYAGSATTLLAARAEGRNCVGAEIDPETYEKAKARLSRPHTLEMFR